MGHTFAYAYDKAVNLIQSADQRSDVLNYVYDKIGCIQEARNSQNGRSETEPYLIMMFINKIKLENFY